MGRVTLVTTHVTKTSKNGIYNSVINSQRALEVSSKLRSQQGPQIYESKTTVIIQFTSHVWPSQPSLEITSNANLMILEVVGDFSVLSNTT